MALAMAMAVVLVLLQMLSPRLKQKQETTLHKPSHAAPSAQQACSIGKLAAARGALNRREEVDGPTIRLCVVALQKVMVHCADPRLDGQ